MITEDYVSFETAKLLKEKGFSENTACKYAGEGGITEKWYDDYRERVLRFDLKEGYLIEPPMEYKDQYEIIGNTISAPTLQMAVKWLREDKKILISIFCHIDKGYWFCIQHFIDLPYKFATSESIHRKEEILGKIQYYDTYEQACEAAIKYCLKNLI